MQGSAQATSRAPTVTVSKRGMPASEPTSALSAMTPATAPKADAVYSTNLALRRNVTSTGRGVSPGSPSSATARPNNGVRKTADMVAAMLISLRPLTRRPAALSVSPIQ